MHVTSCTRDGSLLSLDLVLSGPEWEAAGRVLRSRRHREGDPIGVLLLRSTSVDPASGAWGTGVLLWVEERISTDAALAWVEDAIGDDLLTRELDSALA